MTAMKTATIGPRKMSEYCMWLQVAVRDGWAASETEEQYNLEKGAGFGVGLGTGTGTGAGVEWFREWHAPVLHANGISAPLGPPRVNEQLTFPSVKVDDESSP
jgi:hypothetical protein